MGVEASDSLDKADRRDAERERSRCKLSPREQVVWRMGSLLSARVKRCEGRNMNSEGRVVRLYVVRLIAERKKSRQNGRWSRKLLASGWCGLREDYSTYQNNLENTGSLYPTQSKYLFVFAHK